MSHKSFGGVAARWFCRKYKLFPGETELKRDAAGNVLNEVVWEDEAIAAGDNHNVVTTVGRQLADYNLLSLAGSGFPLFMAMGSGNTPAAAVGDTRLIYELIGDANRPYITLSTGAPLDSTAVAATPYTDTNYTPNYEYQVQFTVMGEMNGATSANVGAPIQEIGLVTAVACPASPTGTSGVLYNHYIFSSPTTLDLETVFQAILVVHN